MSRSGPASMPGALLTALVLFASGLVLAPGDLEAQSSRDQEFLVLINEARVSRGVAPLRFDPRAQQWAESWTPKMVEHGQPFHQELQPFVGGSIVRVGENVGVSTDGVEGIFQGFMASPPHRANILDPSFTHVGIGSLPGRFQRRKALWTTFIFLRMNR